MKTSFKCFLISIRIFFVGPMLKNTNLIRQIYILVNNWLFQIYSKTTEKSIFPRYSHYQAMKQKFPAPQLTNESFPTINGITCSGVLNIKSSNYLLLISNCLFYQDHIMISIYIIQKGNWLLLSILCISFIAILQSKNQLNIISFCWEFLPLNEQRQCSRYKASYKINFSIERVFMAPRVRYLCLGTEFYFIYFR